MTELEHDQLESSSDSDDTDSDVESLDSYPRDNFLSYVRQSPHFYFVGNQDGGQTEVYSLFKCLLSINDGESENDGFLDQIKNLDKKHKWIVILLAGGRFASAVFNKEEVVAHKTFSRYTARAKQGGSQAARDSQQPRNAPKSAGAQLRRYNEAALVQDVRGLLTEWKDHLREADFIFLRCSSYHSKIFYGTEGLLSKSDTRIKGVPFLTHRPTLAEVQRVHHKLSSILFEGVLDDFNKMMMEKFLSVTKKEKRRDLVMKKNKCKEKGKKQRITSFGQNDELEKASQSNNDNNETGDVHNGQTGTGLNIEEVVEDEGQKVVKKYQQDLYTAVARGDSQDLEKLLESVSESGLELENLINHCFGRDLHSSLHVAARLGNVEIVEQLLNWGANPTVVNSQNQVPFQVCNNRNVREAFREFRGRFPDKWAWNKAQVPEPLTEGEKKEKEAKAAERKRTARNLQKKKQKERKAAEQEQNKLEEEKNKYLELSDREKRALAAERRILEKFEGGAMEKPILNRCFMCAKDISGLVPFEYSDNTFCTIKCLKEHKQKENK